MCAPLNLFAEVGQTREDCYPYEVIDFLSHDRKLSPVSRGRVGVGVEHSLQKWYLSSTTTSHLCLLTLALVLHSSSCTP